VGHDSLLDETIRKKTLAATRWPYGKEKILKLERVKYQIARSGEIPLEEAMNLS